MSGQPFTNRLINEKSPYLLQHAHNPVDWYPWGEEAFTVAKEQNKPIFLSIGYATCHWCHMMEKETFSDEEVAALLNKTCVSIKVDREELPEVDAIYMELAQSMMVGTVGWPLNLLLSPDLKPFFSMTYVPPSSSAGLMGMTQMVERIQEIWEGEERIEVIEQADKMIETMESDCQEKGSEMPDATHVENSAELIFKIADPIFGGIKGMPKFPAPCQLLFMLRVVYSEKDSRALFFVEKTLQMLQRGGIRDHLGGGFSRYAVDDRWVMPHFEKMLYDNALLGRAFMETWQMTKMPLFHDIAKEILEYLLTVMRHDNGGFFCAEDADSEGKEGYFYTWTYQEVREVLGDNEALTFCEYYNISEEGNFQGGRNILHATSSIKEFAEIHGLESEDIREVFEKNKKQLSEAREKRIPPFKDDKILCSWNGLMIYCLSEAYKLFLDERFLEAAQKAARFIKKTLWKEGRLLRRWCDGDARFNTILDDYSFMIQGLLNLFECDGEAGWLAWAMQLNHVLDKEYKAEDGAYYMTDGKDPYLLVRRCEYSDGALPAGNAVQCENLLRFYQLTGEETYKTKAENVLSAVKEYLDGFTPNFCYHLMALQRYLDRKAITIVIALNGEEQHKKELQKVFADNYIPHKAVVWRKDDDEHLFEMLPQIREKKCLKNQTTLYLFQKEKWKDPVTDVGEMLSIIKKF